MGFQDWKKLLSFPLWIKALRGELCSNLFGAPCRHQWPTSLSAYGRPVRQEGTLPKTWWDPKAYTEAGLIVKSHSWERETRHSVVSTEGGHCPGVHWTLFSQMLSVLPLHLKNRSMTKNEGEKSYLTTKSYKKLRSRQNRKKKPGKLSIWHVIFWRQVQQRKIQIICNKARIDYSN